MRLSLLPTLSLANGDMLAAGQWMITLLKERKWRPIGSWAGPRVLRVGPSIGQRGDRLGKHRLVLLHLGDFELAPG